MHDFMLHALGFCAENVIAFLLALALVLFAAHQAYKDCTQ